MDAIKESPITRRWEWLISEKRIYLKYYEFPPSCCRQNHVSYVIALVSKATPAPYLHFISCLCTVLSMCIYMKHVREIGRLINTLTASTTVLIGVHRENYCVKIQHISLVHYVYTVQCTCTVRVQVCTLVHDTIKRLKIQTYTRTSHTQEREKC